MGLASRRCRLRQERSLGRYLVTLSYNKVHTVAYVARAYGNVGGSS